ncbi:uncharacterized protein MELLADRAFT_103665 [Melampsora larici-populina 98AG31]|uniref:Uncharacterized protein n=1 Tax=Melampsora larici-populina (strain 98AG31 / pathotype 3-4-7) TaxID=747676 RepID=F4RC28_MELLP|nr:uncharacterized protein MELLADRAFT_103665 [Melampsora larici-populina 98AG31]EGG10234.1 hypothetical protein MELLADRAFT_103665 [Melampsora larici-populina 98AG31]
MIADAAKNKGSSWFCQYVPANSLCVQWSKFLIKMVHAPVLLEKFLIYVAMQCISEAFEVEWSPDSTSPLTMKPGNLLSVFEVFVKTQKKVNDTIRKSLATAKSKAKLTSSTSRGPDGSSSLPGGAGAMPDLASMMGQGGGGMPDLSALMNNPMMAQMAQSMMANGGLERMMQNPMVQQMMNSMGGGGGGMPDLSALMNNPAAREAAASLMGGSGTGSSNRNNANNPSNDNMFS